MALKDYYINIDGNKIKGEATQEGHKDEIQIQRFEWDAHHESSVDSQQGQSTAAVKMNNFRIWKKTCKASPELMISLAQKIPYKTVKITASKTAAKKQAIYLTWTLTNVTICKYVHRTPDDPKDAIPEEEIHFTFDKIKIEYKPQPDDGAALGAAATAEYDYKNRK
ncbi:MAG: type VI secretion system tube protein Hcp [Verrucomicrobiales bacterium]|nr:type VI secretion system tube protein Hcp [Verrucomicrobiales bacterium]